MKKWLVFIGILLFISNVFAQKEETVFDYSGLKLTGVWGGPTFVFSGIGDKNTCFRGGFGGLEFNKSISIAYAAYWLEDKIELSQLPGQKVDMRYNGLLLGYSLKPVKVLHPKFMLLVASGKLEVENEKRDRLFVLQPGAGVEINVFKWWHIDILGGYRIVKGTDISALSDSDLSAPFGEIKLRFGISWGWF
ncbi:MAG: hypothetical protein ACI8P3_001916 [Saprospiraceae bacterium]|jgi:hypothetical protein